jgi:ABC-type phosphate/phosphonate transport system substrate-binding protein
VEAKGGKVAVRGIRGGSASYRAVVVTLASRSLTLDGAELRAAWVDRSSTSGHLLPRAFLRDKGVAKLEESFHGSYRDALEEVLQGRADVTATWASATDATQQHAGYRELLGERSGWLHEIGYSRPCPNDAIVLSPRLSERESARWVQAFLTIPEHPYGPRLARQVFGAERFEPAPPGSYTELKSLFDAP